MSSASISFLSGGAEPDGAQKANEFFTQITPECKLISVVNRMRCCVGKKAGVIEETRTADLTRRDVLAAGGAGLAAVVLPAPARASDETIELIEQFIGRKLTDSNRLRLEMPAVFPTGYTVPMMLEVASPMTEVDHVKHVTVFAPKNPLIEVVGFHFAPLRSAARVSTRIRLAGPQYVVAVAEMNDGTFLMTKTWVDVATNGCA